MSALSVPWTCPLVLADVVDIGPDATQKNFYSLGLGLPEMVRLEAAETGARRAGRAALVAIWVARREATTREAIVMDL